VSIEARLVKVETGDTRSVMREKLPAADCFLPSAYQGGKGEGNEDWGAGQISNLQFSIFNAFLPRSNIQDLMITHYPR
jgi:hypothetical protein